MRSASQDFPRAEALQSGGIISGALRRGAIALAIAIISIAHPSSALPARSTADVLDRGHWSVGAFDPLRVGVARDVELTTHPILDLLLSPNVEARVLFRRVGALRVTGEYGVSVPTFAMRLTQGYLFPSWEKSDNRVGWFVVPSVGLAVSYGERTVATGRMTTSIGIPIGRNDATTMDTWAPLELLLAPALTGYRSHLTLGLDHPITRWLRGRVSVDGWLIGPSDPPKSQVFLGASGALDLRVSERGTLTLGAIVYDYDQRRTVVERGDDGRWQRKRVRSLDVWPMLDFVYRH